jgi:hypothetical protein
MHTLLDLKRVEHTLRTGAATYPNTEEDVPMSPMHSSVSLTRSNLSNACIRYTCPNTEENDPDCAFHQFSSVTPAAHSDLVGGARAGAPASVRLYKPAPMEEIDGLENLLVTGEEACVHPCFPAPLHCDRIVVS